MKTSIVFFSSLIFTIICHTALFAQGTVRSADGTLPSTTDGIISYTITASAGANGMISPSGAVSVVYGNDQTFTITPDVGYYVEDVHVDSVSIGATASYTFTNVTAKHTIEASFAIQTFEVNASAGAGGSIAPSGSTIVNYGDSLTFTVTPDTGYYIADVFVDSVSVGAVPSYTFTNISANHTIEATFAIQTNVIFSASGPHGTITPSGAIFVNYGSSQKYVMTPDPGYHVLNVLVDGASVGPMTSYVFTDVKESHFIGVRFALNTYTISASAGANGTISPSGAVSVNHGSDKTFTITPDVGYYVADVHVDSISIGVTTSYTFTNVTANHTIEALFAIQTFKVSASAGSGGSMSPSGSTIVDYGSSLAFTVTPDVGYYIADVHVDTTSLGAVSSFTLTNITENHTVTATFGINMYKITASAGAHGTISPSGSTIVNYGDSLKFTITPHADYFVSDVHVDSISVGGVTEYTFRNISSNHLIEATFEVLNHLPTAARLIGITNAPNDTFYVDVYGNTVTFGWHPSSDSDSQDSLKYSLHVFGTGFDSTIIFPAARDTVDVSFGWTIAHLLQLGELYKWTVTTTDGHANIASPDTLSFVVTLLVAVDDGQNKMPKVFALHQNYPNPFNPSTVIQFDLPHQSVVTLAVYNLLGQKVATLIDHHQMDIGYQKAMFDAEALPSGVYFYRIMAEEKSGNQFVSVKRMLIVK